MLLEEVGAVVQGADADEVGGAVRLAVHGDRGAGRLVGVGGLVPGRELLADVGESAVADVPRGVGVAVLDDVRGAARVVEGGLDLLGPGVDGDVLDVDLAALVRLLVGGHGPVDHLGLGPVVDLLEEPDPEVPGLLVLAGGGVGGLRGTGGGGESGEDEGRHGGGQAGQELHLRSLRRHVASSATHVSHCTTGRSVGRLPPPDKGGLVSRG